MKLLNNGKKNNKFFFLSKIINIFLYLSLNKYYVKSIECDTCIYNITENKCRKDNGEECNENCFPKYLGLILINKLDYKCYDKNSYKYFGKFIYNSCDEENAEQLSDNSSECKCSSDKKFTTETIYGRTRFKCVTNCNKYYIENKDNDIQATYMCVDACSNYIKRNDYDISCVEECSPENKIFIKDNQKYCLDTCPYEKIFYEKNSNEKYECLDSCSHYKFSQLTNHDYKCINLDECNGKQKLIDIKSKTYICNNNKQDTDNCPSDFPFYYEGFCLKTCEDTNEQDFNYYTNKEKVQTYSWFKSDKNICSKDCKNGDIIYYIDEEDLICVNNCTKTHLVKFYKNDDNKCFENCFNSEYNYLMPSTFECLKERDTEKCYNILEENGAYICYQKCPIETGKIFVRDKKCMTCILPNGINDIKLGEGFFILHKKDNTENVDKYENIKCFESCIPPYNFRRYDDNECLYNEGRHCHEIPGNLYKYHKYLEENICYKSCLDINYHGLRAEFECVEDCNDNEYYYYAMKDIKQCITNEQKEKICKNVGNYYLKDKECVKDCLENEFKILYKIDKNGILSFFGKCLSNTCSDIQYKYYNNEEKICYENCPYKELDNNNDLDNNDNGNCFEICPDSHPYESIDNKKCYKNYCPYKYYFITNSYIKKCVNDCKSIGKYFINSNDNNIECINQCEKFYNISNNECLDTCPDSYYIEDIGYPQPCLERCPDEYAYYYENERICRKNCKNGYLKQYDSTICVGQCNPNEYIILKNICSDKCTKEEPFFYNLGNSVNKCGINCKSIEENNNNLFYYKYDTIENYNIYKCVDRCEGVNPFYKGFECVNKCDEKNGMMYINDYKCLYKCPSNYYFEIIYDSDNIIINYNCSLSCSNYITSTNECVSQCPYSENYIGADKRCKPWCQLIDGEFYYKIGNFLDIEGKNYNIYQCMKECDNDEKKFSLDNNHNFTYNIDGTKECVIDCENYYLSKVEKKCYKQCLRSPINPYSTVDENNINVCSTKCYESSDKKKRHYYGGDKICTENCNADFDYNIINNNENGACVNQCDNISDYKYLLKSNNIVKDKIAYYCTNDCSIHEEANYFILENLNCTNECMAPFNCLTKEMNMCSEKCLEGYIAKPLLENEITELKATYLCQKGCPSGYFYYEDERICIEQCKENDYQVEDTQICVKSCDEIKSNFSYHFYEKPKISSFSFKSNACVKKCPNDLPFLDYDNHCKDRCTLPGFNYYNSSTKICMNSCPEGTRQNDYLLSQGIQCDEVRCVGDTFLDAIRLICVGACSNAASNHLYYKESDRICLKECKNGLYRKIETNDGYGYQCVDKCTFPNEIKEFYLNGNECVEVCKEPKKYVVAEYDQENPNDYKTCRADCPPESPFYKGDDDYKCYKKCDKYYITNKNKKINGKLCVENCLENYPNIYEHNSTHKECLKECPEYANYIHNNKCYKECPSEAPFHDINRYICKVKCDDSNDENNYVYKKTMECLPHGCEMWQFLSEDIVILETFFFKVKYCLDSCKENNYKIFSNENRICVSECDKDKYLRGNFETGECDCQGLYNIDNNGKKICFSPEVLNCKDSGTEYIIQVNGTNQCIEFCSGILSPNDDICYDDLPENIKCPNNTKFGIYKGKLKCDCEFNFYRDSNDRKICLGENEKCPDRYKYIYVETNECLENCGNYLYRLEDKCYLYCPKGMNNEEGECKCVYNWYKNEEGIYYCLDRQESCIDDYPYLIVETRECVKDCSNTPYPFIREKECIKSCEDEENYILKKDIHGNRICICKYTWFYNDIQKKNIICDSQNKNKKNCSELTNNTLEYYIGPLGQCTSECPYDYNFHFNKECYHDCSDNNDLERKDNSFECKCKNRWRIINDKEIQCDNYCKDNEYFISITKECVPKESNCSYNQPYIWNNGCYENCEDIGNDIEKDDLAGFACKCKFNWYYRKDKLKDCLPKNYICPSDDFDYYINDTRECTNDNSSCLKIFNYVCYNECPQDNFTINSNNDNKTCICNQKKGKWYNETIKGKLYLKCGYSDSCLSINNNKIFLDNDTNQCVSSCEDVNKYEYLNICYTQCPSLTEPVKGSFRCKLSEKYTEEDLEQLVKMVENDIIEIYPQLSRGGLIINNNQSNATIHIYGLEKDKDLIMRTNLAYIDLSKCFKKIRQINKLEKNEEIVAIKLELQSKNEKLVVNPVEYEFVNSETGDLLDATVCEKNEVIISYPITYFIKDKRESRNLPKFEDETIREISDKFERGKLLYLQDNSIDSFNYNSSIYTNICYSLVVDGKDLTLEDRISYFYPNYSFCETVCSYDHTDFIGERIYCNCSIKRSLEIDRPHAVIFEEYNKNETDNCQKGPTNLPILKCLPNIKISNNPAFYYCAVFFIIEVGLIFITIFKGISSLFNRIKTKFFKEEDNSKINKDLNYEEKGKKNKKNKYTLDDKDKNQNNITNNYANTSERKMNNNPPRRKNDLDENLDKSNEIAFINLKKMKSKNKIKDINRITDEKFDLELFSETEKNSSNINYYKYLKQNDKETRTGFLYSIKKEDKFLREKYSKSIAKDKFDAIIIILTSILDKIYFTRILLLYMKYEIVPFIFSLYLLCHMILLTFCGFFFDIKTISKTFRNENYPNIGYYILYGFIGNIIVWCIYKLFCCFLENDIKIRKILKRKSKISTEKKLEKYNKITSGIKRNVIICTIIEFFLFAFCSLYLIAFCGIYLGTKKRIFIAYAIAVIEIIILKIIYGFVLGILRKISIYYEKYRLYNVILFFNKYIS